MVVPRLMLGAETIGPRFNIITLRDSHLLGYARSAGPLRHLGFTATLGWNEVKVIAGATLDLNMDLGSDRVAGNEEFVLYHTEPVESSGFCIHLKLPHYVTFQSSLDALRGIPREDTPKKTADQAMEEAEAYMTVPSLPPELATAPSAEEMSA